MTSDQPTARGSRSGPVGTSGPDPWGLERLSARQLQVLELLATGASAKAIAEQLDIKPGTVKQHLALVYSKLGVSNRVQATRAYPLERAGTIQPERRAAPAGGSAE